MVATRSDVVDRHDVQGGKGFAREIRGKDEQLPPPPSDDA